MSSAEGRRRWWAVLPTGLAGLACAACCVVPALIGAGMLAGGGVISAVLGWLPGLTGALVAVAAAAVFLPARARRGHGTGCEGGSGCGCGTETMATTRATSAGSA